MTRTVLVVCAVLSAALLSATRAAAQDGVTKVKNRVTAAAYAARVCGLRIWVVKNLTVRSAACGPALTTMSGRPSICQPPGHDERLWRRGHRCQGGRRRQGRRGRGSRPCRIRDHHQPAVIGYSLRNPRPTRPRAALRTVPLRRAHGPAFREPEIVGDDAEADHIHPNHRLATAASAFPRSPRSRSRRCSRFGEIAPCCPRTSASWAPV